MERRATPARVVTGVALVVVAAGLLLWLFAPTGTVVDAPPREAAAESRAEPPVAPPAAPIIAAPIRSETPPARETFAPANATWRPLKDDAPPIDEATLVLRVVQADTGTPCDRLWVTTDLDRSRSTAGLSLKVFGLVASAARWTDGDGVAELKLPAHVALVVTVTSPLRGVADVEQKFEPLATDERRAWTIPIALPAKAHRTLRCIAAATGAPVAGATLKLGQKVVGASDGDGRFEFVIDHEHDDPIVALAPGFATGVVAWEELKAATDERPCELALEAGATLEVSLADAAGAPVQMAQVYVAPDDERFDGRLRSRNRALEQRRWPWSPVDASGRVRFENLAVGVPLDVSIDGGPFGTTRRSRWPRPRVVFAVGETRQLEVRLRA